MKTAARLWALDWLCGVLAYERVTITPDPPTS
jgi:type IV secretion system protein VirB4